MAGTPKLGIEELASQYGYAAAFFNTSPELKSLITQAVAGQWTADRFRAKFQATQWYRSRSAGVRTWLELANRDPKEAYQRTANQYQVLLSQANQMGLSIPQPRLLQIARDSLMFGWPQEFTQQLLASEFHYKGGGSTTGHASSLEDFIRRTANDYGVTVSDSQVGTWVGGALAGKYTEEHLQDFVRDMARSKYPGLGKYLEQGFTVRQVADPYIQSYSQILEKSVDTVQMDDPLIQRALQGVAPTKPGQEPQSQSVYDFEKSLRQDPRWRKTKNAHESMTNATLGVLQDMGVYA